MGITRTLRVIGSAALTGALLFASASPAAADRVRDDQWALKSLDVEAVWKVSRGEGQTVAVIDDPVNVNHPDLKGNVLKGKDFRTGDGLSGPPTSGKPFKAPAKGERHGTSMAGNIVGHGHGPGNRSGVMGLAPEAKVLSVAADSRLDGAVRYAVDHGASVINISQGDAYTETALADAVGYALQKDVLVVAANGNEGRKNKISYPAAYPGAVAVSAVGEDGQVWEKSNGGEQTLLSAPGEDLPSAGASNDLNGYALANGTSGATAYVSAAAALIRAKYPHLTAGQVANRLVKTAEKPSTESPGRDDRYGYGSIRPLAALKEDIPKGSKYGPLAIPDRIKQGQEEAQQAEEDAKANEQNDRKQIIGLSAIGLVLLLIVGGVVALVVRARRKQRNNGPGGPGGPGAPGVAPYPPGQAPGYGVPPQQPAPPQQSPYNN